MTHLKQRKPQRNRFVAVAPYGEEELVADARHGVSPGQMVERKVVALLGGSPGMVAQAGGGAPNPRRLPGGLP